MIHWEGHFNGKREKELKGYKGNWRNLNWKVGEREEELGEEEWIR